MIVKLDKLATSVICIFIFSVSLFFFIGAIGGAFTKLNIDLSSTYESGRKETLRVRFNNINGQVTFLGSNRNSEVIVAVQYNGWFFRWGNVYLFPAIYSESSLGSIGLRVKVFYIEEISDNNYLLLSHMRGVYLVDGKASIPLKGIFS